MKTSYPHRNKFRPVMKKKILDEVYDQLLSLISNGKLKPGERLPPERVLARDLKVSRQSIREALKRAESKGLVKVRQGEGTFILSAASHLIESPFLTLMTEEVEKIYEFIEIRKLIEVWCAKKAAEFITAKELKKMEKALSEMEKLIDSREILGKPDIDFHIAIAEASHNTLMVHMMTTIKQIFLSMFKISNFIRRPGKNKILIKQHQEIYEAIKNRNPELAGKKMERHLLFVETEWREEMNRQRLRR
ncbi:MAG TPA: FadR/GntR family transcriptional regulator [Thermodesulfobacteriota bacterium]|nr:FadR/GntR family transcriptional regulator [Thermodesulfobacteriota bacterium]